ncbi:MAG: hypothetical protein CMA12_03200 [Euryarchaeota archaeon]|nr:hypothetical protein [Euryarchaeota archaeon]
MSEDSEKGEWWSPPPPDTVAPVQVVNPFSAPKSPLPPVVGVTYSILSVLLTLAGLFILWIVSDFVLEPGWWDNEADSEPVGLMFVAISLFVIFMGAVGIMAGVLIARRRRIGVYIAWGMCAAALAINGLMFIGDPYLNPVNLGCNLACALWVGIPLMVSSASIHMQ